MRYASLSSFVLVLSLLGLPAFRATGAAANPAAAPLLKPGDRVAIIGDSITEQKRYSVFIETYLRACVPQFDARVIQLGWSGETAAGFAGRMDNDLMPWKPSLATLCYGMNDGRYQAYQPSIGNDYSNNLVRIVKRFSAAGTRVLVGSPGVVDSQTWRSQESEADIYYNQNLATLGAIGQSIAAAHGGTFADVRATMLSSMVAAKAALGAGYHVAGGDGVHPASNGHLCMAYAFLKGMGLDGQIGTVSVNWPEQAKATEGHVVKSFKDGQIALESTRYPFCFTGGEKDPNSTASILPYLPFNQDLNRFVLTVQGLPAAQARVSWGTAQAVFTREQLEQGVNLAATLLNNPFCEPFQKVVDAVSGKQARETQLIKGFLSGTRSLDSVTDDAELTQALTTLRSRVFALLDRAQAPAQAAVVPVAHTIQIVPMELTAAQ